MSILSAVVSRVSDKLVLCSAIPDILSEDLRNKSFKILEKVTPTFNSHMVLEDNEYTFYLFVEKKCAFLICCDRSFPKVVALKFLEDISQQFFSLFGATVDVVSRENAFSAFSSHIDSKKVFYNTSKQRLQFEELDKELNQVKDIITKTVDDVIERGEKLTMLQDLSTSLVSDSKRFRQNAQTLDSISGLQKQVDDLKLKDFH
eukprot:MONOS_5447.1-p1 / transcript=MONOS_5447.1 / gene=MONOS_5447 / organism=Monocercomonoides_exilis_PA203 / gene_product= Vesicle transport protein Sec22B / transcript_product= Vesicle transport protein Sec22B / location=Mono_scaffold00158:54988-55943(-) / protein_length=203 / sequence_SO=supercontig / SO=protein_coding / is_pseudo=false